MSILYCYKNQSRFRIVILMLCLKNISLAMPLLQQTLVPKYGHPFYLTQTGSGSVLCADDMPWITFTAAELSGTITKGRCVPLEVQCAYRCYATEHCNSFNWKDDIELCEFFSNDTISCVFNANCRNFQRTGSYLDCLAMESSEPTTAESSKISTNQHSTEHLSTSPMQTMSEQETSGCSGEFIVQVNINGSSFFKKTWTEYRNGFGHVNDTYFWIGNERLYQMTNVSCSCSLRIDVLHRECSGTGYYPSYGNWVMVFGGTCTPHKWYYIEYSSFSLSSEADGYVLRLGSPTAGSMGDSLAENVNKPFSAYDNDHSSGSCAKAFGAGWWYGTSKNARLTSAYCGTTNLNTNMTYFFWPVLSPDEIVESTMTATCDPNDS